MKTLKKSIALFMAAVMLISLVPGNGLTVYAEEVKTEETITEEELTEETEEETEKARGGE